MKSKITIIETGIKDGIFSKNAVFYPKTMTTQEIKSIFKECRNNLGKKYNIDGNKIVQSFQKNSKSDSEYPDGTYYVLDPDKIKEIDYWNEKIPSDIIILEQKHKGIIVGHQMADCPILIAEDRKLGVTALSHCGAVYINRKLPIDTIKSLQKEYNSNLNDIYVYIGSCATKKTYIYDKYPLWATNKEVWKNCIVENNNNYYIDMVQAITNQLNKIGIKNIEFSNRDTVTDDYFYSHIAAYNGKINKKGQNFVGFFYK